MSTRACYRFIPENGPSDWPGVVTVYKHHDGNPEGAARAIEAATDFAWPPPRFEADEFAAAFVAANKMSAERYRAKYEKEATAAEAKGEAETAAWLRRQAGEYGPEGRCRNMIGGGIRLVPFEGFDAHRRFAEDTEYLYDIRCIGGRLSVTAYTTVERDGKWWVKPFFAGTTKQLAKKTAPSYQRRTDGDPDNGNA